MIKIWKIKESAVLPKQMTDGSVGYDICSAEEYIIGYKEFVLIKTGLVVKPPEGFHIEIALRSSMPMKKGLLIPHGFGVIDNDYCGEGDELCIPVYKFGTGTKDYVRPPGNMYEKNRLVCHVQAGERIAQIILRKTYQDLIVDRTGFPFEAEEDRGGFGSTGE